MLASQRLGWHHCGVRTSFRLLFTLGTLVLSSFSAGAQNAVSPELQLLPVTELPPGSVSQAYGIYASQAGEVLVVEQRDQDGTIAYFTFDDLGGTLRARLIGAQTLPGQMSPFPTHRPVERTLDGASASYWVVRGERAPDQTTMLVSAPQLEARRATPVSGGSWPLSPPEDSALTLRRVELDVNGMPRTSCVLEANLIAVQDRMTTFGAWWIRAFGEPHLLLGIVHAESNMPANAGFRLYNDSFEVVAELPSVLRVDANIRPDIVLTDLTGDGSEEILVAGAEPGPPFAVIRVSRNAGMPVFGYHHCTVRANGPDVSRLQRALEQAGYAVGASGIDGWYGPDTRAAVIRLQRDRGLAVTGVVSRDVWNALGVRPE